MATRNGNGGNERHRRVRQRRQPAPTPIRLPEPRIGDAIARDYRTAAGEARLLAALGHGPGMTPELQAQITAEFVAHVRTFTAADTAEDVRARTDELARDVYRRHGRAGVDELRRLAGEW